MLRRANCAICYFLSLRDPVRRVWRWLLSGRCHRSRGGGPNMQPSLSEERGACFDPQQSKLSESQNTMVNMPETHLTIWILPALLPPLLLSAMHLPLLLLSAMFLPAPLFPAPLLPVMRIVTALLSAADSYPSNHPVFVFALACGACTCFRLRACITKT